MLTKSASIILILVASVMLMGATQERNCVCILETPTSAQELLSDYDVIFLGWVRGMRGTEGTPSEVAVTFNVSRVWKGDVEVTATITTEDPGVGCGYWFQHKSEYLVFARNRGSDHPECNCTHTAEKAEADSLITLLGEPMWAMAEVVGVDTIRIEAASPFPKPPISIDEIYSPETLRTIREARCKSVERLQRWKDRKSGIVTYRYWPVDKVRPSEVQFSAIKELLLEHRSYSAGRWCCANEQGFVFKMEIAGGERIMTMDKSFHTVWIGSESWGRRDGESAHLTPRASEKLRELVERPFWE